MSWLLQSLFSRMVWEILLITFLGGALSLLRAKWPTIAPSVMYGIGGMALACVILFTVTGRPVFSMEAPETTADNVEQNIRNWFDRFGVAVSKENDDSNMFFKYAITLRNGNRLTATRPKDNGGRFIALRSNLIFSPDLLASMNKMNQKQRNIVTAETNLEMARAKVEFSLDQTHLSLLKMVPITSSLTEDTFANDLDEMDYATVVGTEAVTLSVDRNRPSELIPESH